jgi:hypothetical protein
MLALSVLGALFLVGVSMMFLIESLACGTIDIVMAFKYGSLWGLFPGLAFALTNNTYVMAIASCASTAGVVYLTQRTLCPEKPSA